MSIIERTRYEGANIFFLTDPVRSPDEVLAYVPRRILLKKEDFPDNVIITIDPDVDRRIDLYANNFFGDYRYWWIIADWNDMLYPPDEFIKGRVIIHPSVETFFTIILPEYERVTP